MSRAAILLVVALLAAPLAASRSRASGPTALYVAPSGIDSGPCTEVAPCRTFGRAYALAKPGQSILVGPGTYGSQTLAADPSKIQAGLHVVVRPAPGANPYVSALQFGDLPAHVRPASHVTVSRLHIGEIKAWDGARDLLWENITAKSFAISTNAGSGWPAPSQIMIRGGEFGPCTTAETVCTNVLSGRSLVIDGTAIHGQRMSASSPLHVDGLFVRGCVRCSVRRARFYSIAITDVRIQNVQGLPDNREITIENNWFSAPLEGDGVTTRADAIDVDNPVPDLVIRFNSFGRSRNWWGGWTLSAIQAPGTIQVQGTPGPLGTSAEPARVYGNIIGSFSCAPNTIYSYNVWVPFKAGGPGDVRCGVGGRRLAGVEAVQYAEDSPGAQSDLHLTRRSPVIAVPRTLGCPDTDIDGQVRPIQSVCAAGADARRPAR